MDLNSTALPSDHDSSSATNPFYSIQSDNPELADCQPTILKSEVRDFIEWKWWIGGILMTSVAVLGFCANTMSIAVLLRPKIRDIAFNQLLIILCLVDTLFICCNSLSCAHALGYTNGVLSIIREFLDVFAHVSMCASVLMIVALTCERHFAIKSPHKYRVHLRITKWWKHLACYVVPVTLLSIFFNIPLFISLKRSWMQDVTYLKINLFLRMLHPLTTTGVAPIILLLILNIRITRGIKQLQERSSKLKSGGAPTPPLGNHFQHAEAEDNRRSNSLRLRALTAKRQNRSVAQNRREIRMTYVTFAIVGLFFFLNLPRILVGGYEVSQSWLILRCVESGSEYSPNLVFYRWDTISRLLMVLNSSINFLVYCAGSDQFKTEFCNMFLPKSWKSADTATQPRCDQQDDLPEEEEDVELVQNEPFRPAGRRTTNNSIRMSKLTKIQALAAIETAL